MKDLRISQLAKNLINYSVSLKPGENLLIEVFDAGMELASELIAECYKAGANPFVTIKSRRIMKDLIKNTNKEHMLAISSLKLKEWKIWLHRYQLLSTPEWSDIPEERWVFTWKIGPNRSFDIRILHKWCIMRYPTHSMAQMARYEHGEFEDFFFDVCCLDYSR